MTQAPKLTLFNSLSRSKEAFTPLHAGKVGMYVCGVTVYDYCHVGHARVMVVFDVIYRWLMHLGLGGSTIVVWWKKGLAPSSGDDRLCPG